ncbi:hypothetical protein KIH87_11780 [Paraneptunicella aestuarii]|uniref:hypothetical protein n=1 Tax=Paraneptunicella aestuarii TaxID=2831148 RepID=UPI001E455811|nr:hypothetical protein [Paraneptunicella aestuarii]UAA37394.1 hypothetical protein KIH87_11780 [Paraneptunicella aestuarii]
MSESSQLGENAGAINIELAEPRLAKGNNTNAVYFCWPFQYVAGKVEHLSSTLQRITVGQLQQAVLNSHHIAEPEKNNQSIWNSGAPVGNDDISPRIKQVLHAGGNQSSFLPCRLTSQAISLLTSSEFSDSHSPASVLVNAKNALGLSIEAKPLCQQLFPDVSFENKGNVQCVISFNIEDVFLYSNPMNSGALVAKIHYCNVLLVQEGVAIKQRAITANDIQHANYYLYRDSQQAPLLVHTQCLPVPHAPKSDKDNRFIAIKEELQHRGINVSLAQLEAVANTELHCCYSPGKSSLLSLFKPVLGNLLNGAIDIDNQRTFTFSLLTLAEQALTPAIHRLGYQIAKKESYRYPASMEVIEASLLYHHDDVVHYLTPSGGCIMVLPNTHQHANEAFLYPFIKEKGEQVFLPVFVLALIEQHYLKCLEVNNHFDVNVDNLNTLREQLSIALKQLIDFRLNYRYSTVSVIQNHNIVYQRWREVFLLDKRLDEQTQDVKECFELIKYEQETKSSRKLRRLESFSAIAAACIFLFGFFGMNITEVNGVSLFSGEFGWPHWMSIGVLLVAACYVFVVNRNNR